MAVVDLSSIRADWAGGFQARATLREEDGARLIDVTGSGQDLSLGATGADGALTGTTQLALQASERDGVVTITEGRLTNDQMRAVVQGTYGPGVTDLTGDVNVASLAPFGPGWRGSLQAQGSFAEAGDGIPHLDSATSRVPSPCRMMGARRSG